MPHIASRLRRAILLPPIAALALLGAPAHAADAGAAGPLTAAEVDDYVTDYLAESGLRGATVAVTHGTEVVRAGGYGTGGNGRPLGADSPMGIASVSKSMTSLAVLQLVEDGRIGLDDPVKDHLPEFPVPDPRAERITVRQLLNQSSGMSDRGFAEKSERQPRSLEGAVARLRDARLTADPGEEYGYHNPNYHVAARMVEVVSGEPFADYLRRHVFGPLGMDDTTTIEGSWDLGEFDLAKGHVGVLGRGVAVAEPEGYFNGAGGVVSTAEDMARWLIAQNNGGKGADGARVLDAADVTLAHTPSGPGQGYGLGWEVRTTDGGAPRIGHGGVQFTFTAQQVLLPRSGYGIAVMASTGLGRPDAIALTDGLIALAEGRTPPSSGAALLTGVDAVMLAIAVGMVPLGVRGVLRAGTWVSRRAGRPVWRAVLRCVPHLAAIAACVWITELLALVAGGRDLTWFQTGYTVPTVLAAITATAVASGAVLAARATAAVRHRTSTGPDTSGTPADRETSLESHAVGPLGTR